MVQTASTPTPAAQVRHAGLRAARAAERAGANTAPTFGADTTGLEQCRPTSLVEVADGETVDLRITPVANRVGDAIVRMLAYNGSVPGPTIRVRQGSQIDVRVRNDGDHETTVHWHGLRVENRFDGVPHETQAPIPVGGEFTYRLRFPDDGIYWYHPHVREDYGIEMGLYGNVLVDPAEGDPWPPADVEAVMTLDDILVVEGRVAPFRVEGPTHTAMGRFGNVMLTGGRTDLRLSARVGEVVRAYLTNTANTRIFNVSAPGGRMKLVGGDSGRYEREEFVDAVLLAPSERAVVDVTFDEPGEYVMQHATPEHTYALGVVTVTGEAAGRAARRAFETLHANPLLGAERARLEEEHRRLPDKTLVLIAEMPLLYADSSAASAQAWACPMHPEVRSDAPGTCPKCGMKLVPAADAAEPAHEHGGDGVQGGHGGHSGHHGDDAGDGLEWEDLMPDINARTDDSNMVWKLVDADTGAANGEIDWTFRVGDRVKIRLDNTMDGDHPMHHPFHVHGAGRFLVVARDGVVEPNLVWKDTVLARAGETVDIVLDVTNPGLWMAHCHIAEHNQDGMMLTFRVDP